MSIAIVKHVGVLITGIILIKIMENLFEVVVIEENHESLCDEKCID